eukprot:gene799-994_t
MFPHTVPCLANALLTIRSSTNYDKNHSQFNCILNYKNDGTKTTDGSEAWCASINDQNQFLVFGGEVPKVFVGLSTQGRGDADQWVTSFKIRYSLDNVTWFEYDNSRIFQSNCDRNSIFNLEFPTPIRARSIAIHPLSWNNHISMRVELYCRPLVQSFTQVGTAIYTGDNCSLNSGSGSRELVIPVKFETEFVQVPKVALCLDQIDSTDASGQTRLGCGTRNVTTTGFDAVFFTWNQNKVYSLRISLFEPHHTRLVKLEIGVEEEILNRVLIDQISNHSFLHLEEFHYFLNQTHVDDFCKKITTKTFPSLKSFHWDCKDINNNTNKFLNHLAQFKLQTLEIECPIGHYFHLQLGQNIVQEFLDKNPSLTRLKLPYLSDPYIYNHITQYPPKYPNICSMDLNYMGSTNQFHFPDPFYIKELSMNLGTSACIHPFSNIEKLVFKGTFGTILNDDPLLKCTFPSTKPQNK